MDTEAEIRRALEQVKEALHAIMKSGYGEVTLKIQDRKLVHCEHNVKWQRRGE